MILAGFKQNSRISEGFCENLVAMLAIYPEFPMRTLCGGITAESRAKWLVDNEQMTQEVGSSLCWMQLRCVIATG